MRAWSWMAVLVLIVGTSFAAARALPATSATDDTPQPRPQQAGQSSARAQTAERKPASEPLKSLLLNLQIAGLGRDGCDVEVKPANPSCKFRVVNLTRNGEKLVRGKDGAQHVSSAGSTVLELRDVELRGADRTCTVAITVRESGQAPKTVYRGFRVPAPPETSAASSAKSVPTVACYLTCPSKTAPPSTVATGDPSGTRRK